MSITTGFTTMVNSVKTDLGSIFTTITDLSSYLTTSAASSTYATKTSLGNYLTTTTASSTYAPIASPTFTGTVTSPNINATNYNDINGNNMLLQNCYWSGYIGVNVVGGTQTIITNKSSGLTVIREGEGNFKFSFTSGRQPSNAYYHVCMAGSYDGTTSSSCPLIRSVDLRTTTSFNVRQVTQSGSSADCYINGINSNGNGYISVMVTFLP